jgi:Ca2+/Na+ antiporter
VRASEARCGVVAFAIGASIAEEIANIAEEIANKARV